VRGVASKQQKPQKPPKRTTLKQPHTKIKPDTIAAKTSQPAISSYMFPSFLSLHLLTRESREKSQLKAADLLRQQQIKKR
jgi:hypothetical protein